MTETSKTIKESHLERTAAEPRNPSLHTVVLSDIQPVGQTIRVLRLQIPPESPDIQFLPGQWIDTFCPGVATAGGFTLTSAPSRAASRKGGDPRYIELAVRQSSDSPAAEWLWQPAAKILGDTLQVRVGGSFVFPPSLGGSPTGSSPTGCPTSSSLTSSPTSLPQGRFVFVAGGVGINPLISMLSYIGDQQDANAEGETETAPPLVVEVLYSVREEDLLRSDGSGDGSPASRILFLERLAALFSRRRLHGRLQLFLTGGDTVGDAVGEPSGVLSCNEMDVPYKRRRITTADLDAAVLGSGSGDDGATTSIDRTYVYVCGVPSMTDDFAAHLTAPPESGGLGLRSSNVLFEKWW